MGFVEAIMTVDLRHNVVAGFEHGFPDFLARPDLNTLVPLPWEEDVVACLVDLEDPVTHESHPLDSRGVLKRVLAQFAEYGVAPVVGPELEFYLCEPDPDSPRGYRPYAGQDSAVYTVGDVADPKGTLARMLDAARRARDSGRSPPPTSTAAASSRSTCATRPRSTRPTARSASGRWSRRWRRATGCWRRSWASRSTTTRARGSTCTCRWWIPTVRTRARTRTTRTG